MEIHVPTEADDDGLRFALARSLHFDGQMDEWYERLGRGQFRAAMVDGQVTAGAALFAAAQWHGGRAVPAVGINGFGVAPERRGTGVGSAFLAGLLGELHDDGTALALLYPASLRFYRRAGFERAGQRLTYEIAIEHIDCGDDELDLMPFGPTEHDEVRAVYAARAAAGNLERPEWMWRLRLEPKGEPLRYIVRRGAAAEGYIVYTQGSRLEPLTVVDYAALTPAAGRRILGLLASYRSVIDRLVWAGGALDPLVYLLNENLVAGIRGKVAVTRPYDWMLRVVDAQAALERRGYPPGVRARVELDLKDELLPANAGRWTLEVADGAARLSRGGDGRVRLDMRALAAIYTGFMHPHEVALMGTIGGDATDLSLLGAMFGGPRPWLADMF